MTGLADRRALLNQRGASVAPVVETALVTKTPAGGRVTVNSSGVDESVMLAQGVLLVRGDLALILRDQGRAWVVAKAGGQAHSLSGTVVTVPPGSGMITVDVAGTSHVLPFLASYTPTVTPPGNAVAILWTADGGIVLGSLGATPAPPPAPTPAPSSTPPPTGAPPVTRGGVDTFPAVDSGQFRGGRWGAAGNRDVYQGNWGYGANSGAWFYGSGPADWCGSGATVSACRIRIGRRSGGDHGAQVAHLYLHSSPTRPAGDVTRTDGPTDVSIGIGETQWVSLPAAWGQAIVTSGGGIGVTGAPYVVLNGVDSDREAGLLEITWSA